MMVMMATTSATMGRLSHQIIPSLRPCPSPPGGSITVSNKVYDGTTAATIGSHSLSGVIGLDDVSLTGGAANFIDQNVGNNKSVPATGLTLSGTGIANHTLASSSTTANITPVSLTISAGNKSKTAGLPNPVPTATYAGFVNAEDPSVLTTPVSLSTPATDSSPAGTYPITASGGVAPNYTVSYNNGILTVVAVPQLSVGVASRNQFMLTFPTLSTEKYQVEYKDDLLAATWTPFGSPIDGTGSSITVTNQITGQQRFFRVEVLPGE